jgi:hypothetical protein
MTSENNQINSDEISLKELILKIKEWGNYLKSKWKTVLLVTFLGALMGFVYAIIEKPKYKGVLTFAMEEDKGGGGGGLSGALGLANSFGIDLGGAGGGGAFAASNLTDLMKSRLIVEKVLLNPIDINGRTTTLAEYYIKLNKLREAWETIPSLKNLKFLPNSDRLSYTRQQDSILSVFHKNLIDKECLNIMQKDKKVTILLIEVTSKEELFSKLFCENLARETSNFYIETKSKKAKINVDVLQKQVDSIRNELNGSITGFAQAADDIYNLNPAFNVKSAVSKKKQIDVQANTVILTNLVVQLELAKITLRKETPLIQLIDKPILPLEIEKTSKQKAIIFGGVLSGFLIMIVLIANELFKKMIN